MPYTMAIKPGAVSAGGEITIPGYMPPIRHLLKFIVKRKNSITWDFTSSTIATDDVTATGSGTDEMAEAVEKTVVNTTPGAGEVQVTGDRTIKVGDAIADGDLVIITYIAKGEFSGV